MSNQLEPIERLEARRKASRQLSDLPVVSVAVAVAMGVLMEQTLWPVGITTAWTLGPVAMLLMGWIFAWKRLDNRQAAYLLLASISFLAASWSGFNERLFAMNEIGRFANQEAGPVCLEGTILSSPIHYPAEPTTPFHAIPTSDQSILLIEITRLRNGQTWHHVTGRCEVRIAGKITSLEVGRHAQLFGQLRQPSLALNPGERDRFKAGSAKRQLAIVWCESPACFSVLKEAATPRTEFVNPIADGWLMKWVSRRLETFRSSANATLVHHLSEQNVPLASAMLLGNASGVSRGTTDAFRKTGTLHVLVVSGLHVGLVAGLPLLLGAIGLLPMRVAQGLSLSLVVFYALLVGARPPALRAAILAGGAVVAAMLGRQPLGMNSLAGAAITLFAISPGAFQGAGTKLSFLAAATLLSFGAMVATRAQKPKHPIERIIQRSRSTMSSAFRFCLQWCTLLLLATFIVLVITGPLIASEFHLLSPGALLLAIPVMVSVVVVIPSGLFLFGVGCFASMLPGWLINSVSFLPSKLCDLGISLLAELVRLASELPFSFFYTPGPASWWVGLWYGLLGLAAAREYGAPKSRGVTLRLGLALIALAFVPSLLQSTTQRESLRISAIAVGHGSSMLIETPSGEVVLYDAGSLGSPGRSTEIIARFLWSRGIEKIDAVILSHADVDHYNAMPGLIERFSIGAVWTSNLMFDPWDTKSTYAGPAKLEAMLHENQIPIHKLALGDVITIGPAGASKANKKVTLEVLHPTEFGVIGSDNANSLVLGLEYLGKRAILTGDVESPGLEDLLASEPYPCELLIAPHHGSVRSNPPGLIEWCHPKRVLISSGSPHPETEVAYGLSGAQILNTQQAGLITTQIDSTGVRWWSHLSPK